MSGPANMQEAISTLADLLVSSKTFEGAAASVEPVPPATAHARYRTLIEQIPAVTFLASLTGERNELYVSPQIESLLGFTQEEWVGDPVLWYRQTHPGDRERVSINFARACATGEPFREVIRVLARNGQTVWVHAEARFVRDAEGQPLFLQGVGFDVTEQHRAQEIREQLIREQAERAEADRQRERKDQFLAAAAHDLKTPLTAVKGLVQVLERRANRGDDISGEMLSSTLAQVRKSADTMAKLVDQLLDISAMDAGTPLVLRREQVDLVSVVAESIEEHRAISARHELILESAPSELSGTVDAARIERVVSNLLTNAVKYSPHGGKVRVRLKADGTTACPQARLEIQDEGLGIPATDLPLIFERFHRGANVAGRVNGTGIGLAYVQQVVADHGGSIEVDSREGAGSTFVVHLPLAVAAGE